MSNISYKDAWPVKLMRWVARFVSIPWAYWALAIAWFVAGTGYEEGGRTLAELALFITVMIMSPLMFLGAAIIAGVWGKEALGGTVLLADGVLIIVCIWASSHVNPSFVEFFTPSHLPFNFTMVLPPLVAGSLFIACHRIKKNVRRGTRLTATIEPDM